MSSHTSISKKHTSVGAIDTLKEILEPGPDGVPAIFSIRDEEVNSKTDEATVETEPRWIHNSEILQTGLCATNSQRTI